MADTISNAVKELIEFIREASAIIHYFSDFIAIISLYNIIFEHGAVGTVIVWVVIALISAVIAELLKSHIPTPLRIVLRRKGIL
jgi:hypothetical protein